MSRLTQWIDKGKAIPRMDLRKNGHDACVKKLAELEDLEDAGKLLKLPCAVGDMVYEVFYDELNIPQYYICKYEIEDVSDKAVKYADDWIPWEELNNVYFDREEAEKRLRELQEGTC